MGQTTKLIFAFAFFAACIAVAFAAPLLSPSSFSVNEQTAVDYTFQINNTESSNITLVNVTIPAGFTYSGTQSTSANSSSLNFSNSTSGSGDTTLTWSNESGVVLNSSMDPGNVTFSFTATANTTTIGVFNFTVMAATSSETNSFNISVTVNDTTAPTVLFVSPTPSSNSFLKATSLNITANVTDNFNVSSIGVWIFNSTGLVNNSNFSSSPAHFNFTNMAQGNYSYNVTAVDSAGNNGSSVTRTVVLDTTAPVVEIDDSADTTDSTIVGEIRITETGSGISGECDVSGSADITTGSGATYQEFEDEDFNCGEEEEYTVTCYDGAGNSGSDTMTLETLACEDDDDDDSSSSSSSSSGGGGAATTQTWTTTYASDSKELSEMGAVEKTLAEKSRIRVLIGGEKHHVGLKSVTSSAATIEVSSTPQTSKINIGQSQKFDVEKDGLYDLQVTVMSIEDKQAKIVILAVKEPVVALSGAATKETAESGASAAKTANGTAEAATDIREQLSENWIWVVSAVALVVVAIGIFVFFKKRNQFMSKKKR